jgi:secondary thiamine-phosphate synthase enzyme
MVFRQSITVRTPGRGFVLLTPEVAQAVTASSISEGICNVFVKHTSASLLISENADPAVHRDLERFMQRIAPDGSPDYEHDAEGPDDMPSHIRSALTCASLSIPVAGGELLLGTWQGVYLWEHRLARHSREVILTIVGDR